MATAVRELIDTSRDALRAQFRRDVLTGLSQQRKAIPARWFYDHRGSQLFEEITRLPEYYPTRVETGILMAHATRIGRMVGSKHHVVVEFGAGSATKTPLLLGAIWPAAYVPIDISGEFLSESCEALAARYPDLPIYPVEADFSQPATLPAEVGQHPRLGFFPGSTIGNMEPMAAADLLRQHIPDLKVRFVNVVDLMRLQDASEHPHGMSHGEFDMVFTADKPVIFAYHGYPWLIHRLCYRRTNDARIHVRGYKEEGTTTTPFDMVMLNDLDRYHLVIDVIDRVPSLGSRYAGLRQKMQDKRIEAREYTREYGDDIPEVRDWVWPAAREVVGETSVAATLATGGDNE
jgi:hypothetical protein